MCLNQSFTTVMLAGGLRASPLRRQLGWPVLALPVTHEDTLLDLWLEALHGTGGCDSITIVVSTDADAAALRRQLAELNGSAANVPDTRVIVEPAKWRGTAGIIRDVTAGSDESELVLVLEAGCLPPRSLTALLAPTRAGAIATVAVGGRAEPAGAYALRSSVLRQVPDVGFFDIKEQLLPAMYAHGCGAGTVQITDRVIRLHDRTGYLQAVAHSFKQVSSNRCDTRPGRTQAARILGHPLIGPQVMIEPGAVVHDSVVLRGATIGPEAVVSGSIIDENVEVRAGEIVKDAIVRRALPPRRASLWASKPRSDVTVGAVGR